MEEFFHSHFGVNVEHTDCFVNKGLLEYWNGYNSTVIELIDRTHGAGAFENARAEVDRFRRESYKDDAN